MLNYLKKVKLVPESVAIKKKVLAIFLQLN